MVLLNPVAYIYGLAASAIAIRMFLPKKSFYQRILVFIISSIPFIVLCVWLFLQQRSIFTFSEQDILVLRSNWLRSIFIAGEQNIALMPNCLIIASVLLIINCYLQPFLFTTRSVIHFGAAIGAIFAKDFTSKIFWCEIISISAISTVLSERKVPRIMQMIYTILHILAGLLLLTATVYLMESNSVLNHKNTVFVIKWSNIKFLSVIITCAVFLISGLTPFSFSVIDVYGKMPHVATPLMASLFSKITLFSIVPMIIQFQSTYSKTLLSIGSVALTTLLAIRSFFEVSMQKMILIFGLFHVALFISAVLETNQTEQLFNYLSSSMLTLFFLFSVVSFFSKIYPEVNDNFMLMGKVPAPLLVIFLLILTSVPTSITGFSEHILTGDILSYQSMASLFFGAAIATKIAYAYFKGTAISKIKVKTMSSLPLTIIGIGLLFFSPICNFTPTIKNFLHWATIQVIAVIGSLVTLVFFPQEIQIKNIFTKTIIPIGKPILSFLSIKKSGGFIKSKQSINKAQRFIKHKIIILLRAFCFNIFSIRYSVEVLVFIASFMFFFLIILAKHV